MQKMSLTNARKPWTIYNKDSDWLTWAPIPWTAIWRVATQNGKNLRLRRGRMPRWKKDEKP